LGLKISALTFIGCIAYLFYDWRREKGDKWTERIEERTKDLLKKIYKRYKAND